MNNTRNVSLLLLVAMSILSCGKRESQSAVPQDSGSVGRAVLQQAGTEARTNLAKAVLQPASTNVTKPLQAANIDKVKKDAGGLSGFLDAMFGGPKSKAGKDILAMAKEHRNALEWSAEDWSQVRELLEASGEAEFGVFAQNVIDPLFANNPDYATMPTVGSNMMAMALGMNNWTNAVRIMLSAGEMYTWGRRSDESLRIIEAAMARLPTERDEQGMCTALYIACIEDKATCLAVLNKGKEAEEELNELAQKYPDAPGLASTRIGIAKSIATVTMDPDEFERAIAKVRADIDNKPEELRYTLLLQIERLKRDMQKRMASANKPRRE